MGTYNVYGPLTNSAIKVMRKVADKKTRKLSTERQIGWLIQQDEDLVNRLDFPIFCEEYNWKRKGRHCIFPQDSSVVDRLLSAEFESSHLDALELPFDSFILAMPRGYTSNGVEIPSALITTGVFGEYGDKVMNRFCDAIGMEHPEHQFPEELTGQSCLHLVYKDPRAPAARMLYARASIPSSQFDDLLGTNDLDEFQAIAGNYSNSNMLNIMDNEPHDQVIQYTLLKLTLAIGVFNQATDGVHIRDGVPSSKISFIGSPSDLRPRSATLGMPDLASKGVTGDREPHYRRWHFRQLMSERYYQNEHAHRPRGSRWTFVKDAYVSGSQDSAHTAEHSDRQ